MSNGERAGWRIVRDHVYDSFPIFTVKRSTRVNPRTGKQVDFVRIEGLDWVNLIPLTPDNEVVMVRQYRHGSEEHTLELPGGCVEPGEDPGASALRELVEETGYSAERVEPLGTVRPNPALLSNRCSFFVARDVKRVSGQRLDDGEDISVVTIPLPEAIEKIKSGAIDHALVVAAFSYLLLRSPLP